MNDEGACLRYPKLWIALLAVVCLLDLLAPLMIIPPGGVREMFVMAVCLSQLTFHASWITLGPGNLWLRVVSVPLAYALVTRMMWDSPLPDQHFFQLLYLVHWVLVCALLLGLRSAGFRLHRANDRSHVKLTGRQFAMSELAAAVTVSCFVAAAFASIDDAATSVREIPMIVTWGMLLILVMPPMLAVLILNRPWKLAIATLAIPVMLTAAVLLTEGNWSFRDAVALFCLLGSLTAIQLAAWGLVRFEGVRLRRKSIFHVTECSAAEAIATSGPGGPVQSA